MAINIRAVSQQDHQRWAELLQAYADFYQTDLAEGTHERVWSWIHDEQEDFWCDVVECVDENDTTSILSLIHI